MEQDDYDNDAIKGLNKTRLIATLFPIQANKSVRALNWFSTARKNRIQTKSHS